MSSSSASSSVESALVTALVSAVFGAIFTACGCGGRSGSSGKGSKKAKAKKSGGGDKEDGKLTVLDGAKLPWYELDVSASAEVNGVSQLFVFSHGMGGDAAHFKDPITAVMAATKSNAVPRSLLYDCRGHGKSEGWQQIGWSQYHWRALAIDMLQMAVANGAQPGAPAILGGCSMSSVTALYAAMECPDLVSGVVMYMVPQIWEFRSDKSDRLVKKAQDMMKEDPVEANKKLGGAQTDLPPREELAQRLRVPVLLINCREDPAHPASGNEALRDLLGPLATSVIVDKKADLPKTLTKALSAWLEKNHKDKALKLPKRLAAPSYVWPVFSKDQGKKVLGFFNPTVVPEEEEVDDKAKVQGLIMIKPSKIFDSPEPDATEFSRYKKPVLLVACRDDPGNPATTAQAIAGFVGKGATLITVDSKDQIPKALGDALPGWLDSLKSSDKP